VELLLLPVLLIAGLQPSGETLGDKDVPSAPPGDDGQRARTDRLTADGDRWVGTEGDDRIGGGTDNDMLFGGNGADLLVDSSGQDRLEGGNGADTLIADDPNRTDGADSLWGGSGDDVMTGDDSDHMRGGACNDIFRIVEFDFGSGDRMQDSPIVISDFVSGADRIEISVTGNGPFTLVDDGSGGTFVRVFGEALFQIVDVPPIDIDPASATLSRVT
jgi:Ca2+-binding RTX toxin-like protein